MILPSPDLLKKEYVLDNCLAEKVAQSRLAAQKILTGEDKRLAAIVGPCSIHDVKAALEYGEKLRELRCEELFPIMRVFIEKPRTKHGWKGLLYDPHLDGSHDIEEGLGRCRKLFLDLTKMGVAIATEILEPLTLPYFDDLISWGMIGARTADSPYHRQIASAAPFPVGFKNDLHGRCDGALNGIEAASLAQTYIGINEEGRVSSLTSKGNPLAHLVLRGAHHATNYDETSIQDAIQRLQERNLSPRLLVDCSHGNSARQAENQRLCLHALQDAPIAGFLLESHLHKGRQHLGPNLAYGVSITDECLGWEETRDLLIDFCRRRSARSKADAPTPQSPSFACPT